MPRDRRLTAAGCALLVLGGAGCHTTHKERKEEAEAHWGEVRGRIKLQLARQQFEHGLPEEAIDFAEEALGWDPNNVEALILLARARLEQGKLAAAHRSIEKAAGLEEENSELSYVRGVVAERMQRLELAAVYYREARELSDSNPIYLTSEAECLVAQDRAEEALDLIRSNLLGYDHDPSLAALGGEIALHLGDREAARVAFRDVLSSGHYDPVVAQEYALLAVEAGEYADALTVLEPILEREDKQLPNSVSRAAAECMLALRQTEAAKQVLRRMIRRDPDDRASWLLLARAGIMTDDSATTNYAALGAQRAAPEASETLLISAFVHLQKQQLAQAENLLLQFLARRPNDLLGHCLLGTVAARLGDAEGSRAHFLRALQIRPNSVWAREALDRLGTAVNMPAYDEALRRNAARTKPAIQLAARTNAASDRLAGHADAHLHPGGSAASSAADTPTKRPTLTTGAPWSSSVDDAEKIRRRISARRGILLPRRSSRSD